MTWRRVPFTRRLLLHPDSGRSGSAIRALAGASDWRRGLLDRFGSALVAVAGTTPLISAPLPAWPAMTWEELDDELVAALPGLRLIGAVAPRQPHRARLSLLGRRAGNLIVVKLGSNDGELERERQALELISRDPLPGIATPEPLAAGTIRQADTSLGYVVTTALALRRQSAAIDEPLRTFENDLAHRLAQLPRPNEPGAQSDAGLVPVHGDLTPWNLRRTPRGLALFDWESAGWGTPGSDLAGYVLACDQVRRPWTSTPKVAIGS